MPGSAQLGVGTALDPELSVASFCRRVLASCEKQKTPLRLEQRGWGDQVRKKTTVTVLH